jgi:hypothetical protein
VGFTETSASRRKAGHAPTLPGYRKALAAQCVVGYSDSDLYDDRRVIAAGRVADGGCRVDVPSGRLGLGHSVGEHVIKLRSEAFAYALAKGGGRAGPRTGSRGAAELARGEPARARRGMNRPPIAAEIH